MNKPPSIPPPRNVNDLKVLLKQYSGILSPQNRNLIQQVINELEKGDTKSEKLKQISSQMQKSAATTKAKIEHCDNNNTNNKTAPKRGQRTQTIIKGSRKKPPK